MFLRPLALMAGAATVIALSAQPQTLDVPFLSEENPDRPARKRFKRNKRQEERRRKGRKKRK